MDKIVTMQEDREVAFKEFLSLINMLNKVFDWSRGVLFINHIKASDKVAVGLRLEH